MIDLDEALQVQLAALEEGMPLEKVLAELPPEAVELSPLIQLAFTASSMQHPLLRPEVARAQKIRVENALPSTFQPLSFLSWLREPRVRLFMAVASAAFALFAMVVGIGLYLVGPASAHTARLIHVNGQVETAPSANILAWHTLTENGTLKQGDHIRTGSAAGATLVFFDGSQTTIGPDSELVLSTLNGQWGSVLEVQLTQKSGTTSHEVVPLKGNSSFFRVDTPSSEASVHGTSFNVTISPDGKTLIAVIHGEVQVQNSRSKVLLSSGQATTTFPGEAPNAPGYQFRLNGPVSSINAGQWMVAGAPIQITSQTDIQSGIVEGNQVSVNGRILENGQWQADHINLADTLSSPSSFTGIIENMPPVPDTWLINGIPILVNAETVLGQNLKVGTPVEVTFTVLPDQAGWLAKSIISLEEPEIKPATAPAPTQTETLTSTTTVTSVPAAGAVPPTITETIEPKNENNHCDNRAQQQPDGLKLAQKYDVPYDEIMVWYCSGYGFGEIGQAYDLSQTYQVPVSEIFKLRSAGNAWGEIKKLLPQLTTGTPDPKGKKK